MKTFKQYQEDFGGEGTSSSTGSVAVNSLINQTIDGIGVGPRAEPGGTKAVMNKMIRRKKPINVDAKLNTR